MGCGKLLSLSIYMAVNLDMDGLVQKGICQYTVYAESQVVIFYKLYDVCIKATDTILFKTIFVIAVSPEN